MGDERLRVEHVEAGPAGGSGSGPSRSVSDAISFPANAAAKPTDRRAAAGSDWLPDQP